MESDKQSIRTLPAEPPEDLLLSMAYRYDHALAIPGHYDVMFKLGFSAVRHQQKLEATLSIMRQLYEEVSGYGFYKWKETE